MTIQRTVQVAVPPDQAFQAWTARIHLWWPPGHTRHGGRVVLEPDRFVEVSADGEHPLGRVVAWEPPERLVYDFYPGGSPETPTRVVLAFRHVAGGTRVDIEHHRHLLPAERFDRSVQGFLRAWPDVERAYLTFVESP